MERIFVCIASYRDKQLPKTVASLLENAEHPELIDIWILNQVDFEQDQACMLADPEDYPQVEERCIDHTLSRGCCWARAYVYEHLFKDQKFVLQLDSHCRLLKNWDTEVKAMRKGLEDSKAILSHYAMPFGDDEVLKDEYFISFECPRFDEAYKLPRIHPHSSWERPEQPKQIAFVGGGFIFGLGKAFREVPYDPFLYFNGEEQTYAARLWTHGYNIYAPQKSIARHYYADNPDLKRVRHREDNKRSDNLTALSMARHKHLLGIENSDNDAVIRFLNRYWLGKERSLKDYEKFSWVCFKEQTVEEFAKKGQVNEAYASAVA